MAGDAFSLKVIRCVVFEDNMALKGKTFLPYDNLWRKHGGAKSTPTCV